MVKIKKKFRKGTRVKTIKSNEIRLREYREMVSIFTGRAYYAYLEIKTGQIGQIVDACYEIFDGFFTMRIPINNCLNILIDIHQDNLERVK